MAPPPDPLPKEGGGKDNLRLDDFRFPIEFFD